MLSPKQRAELVDALADFNDAMKKHADELQAWERNVLALNMALCTCILQQKVLKREAADIMQKALDQVKHYAPAPTAASPPLLSIQQLGRIVKQEKAVIAQKMAVLEAIVDEGEEPDIRALYNEINAAVEPGDEEMQARLRQICHIMGWVT